ncbi:Transmembrane and coiled-coil domain-containing protein 4 [Nibea albiflora]|uniref:Transmembrane and coiled-coil domain-containing protein 4 n=1 Tax=Nibea albiflora TaxID=240163 RepID=A0ACB7EL10_NIBAL|nr:Transmembrane and coiled-coil domain-containing protein 4 [Nibea albiflora]
MEEKQSSADTKFAPDPGGAERTQDAPRDQSPEEIISRQMSEQSRFAYAALCSVSLGQLFTGPENREQYLQGLVRWLDLDESVMPVMGAFLSGLGFEGSDTFLSILQAEPLLASGATPIIQDLVSFSVNDGQYDARARVLIRHVSCLLRVLPQQLEEFEETLGEKLREAGEESEEESSRRLKRERGRKLRRYLLIGLATVGGGTVIGVTGGLAAPLVAAGASAVLGAGGAAALGSATGIAIMASLFGAAGAGLTGYKMNKCVGAIEEFEFLPLNSGKHLHLTITVTGWLCSGKYSSFQAPWCSLGECGEQYCLVWESRFLRDLGSAMASLLDGLGKRPVSLIGFSLGARVIYYCLQELANDQGSEGVVEDVVLLGAPVDGSEKAWERMTRVVAGKIVNGYCSKINVSALQVNGHLDYMRQMDTILVAVGVPTKEVPGAFFALPQPVTVTQTVDIPDQTPKEQQVEEAETGTEESGDVKDVVETEEMGDGWDIPDISDLLDLNDTESESQDGVGNNLQPASEENATNDDTASASNAPCDGVVEADPDNEHISWSWHDTHWTTEDTHKQRQPNL